MPGRKALQKDQLPNPSTSRTIAALAFAAAKSTGADQHLLEGARQLLRARHRLDHLIPRDLQRHAVWNVLLELFVNEKEGGITHVKQIIIATGEKTGTAMRTIDRVEEAGFILREADHMDRRCVIVRLTDAGRAATLSLLRIIFEPDTQIEGTSGPIAFRPRR